MFEAPELIASIPDIKAIYGYNDIQSSDLEDALRRLDDSTSLEDMDETTCERYEKMLSLVAKDTDTLNDRKFRIRGKILDALPYSYRSIIKQLDSLCTAGYTLSAEENLTGLTVKVALSSKAMKEDIAHLLENVIPLNMWLDVLVLWNNYARVGEKTHKELGTKTQEAIREEVF